MPPRLLLFAAGIALLALLAIGLLSKQGGFVARFERFHVGGDFLAYYCAGKITAQHVDPYRVEPLRTCQHALDPQGWNKEQQDVTPAPLPGYALAAYSLLAFVPYEAAIAVWYVVLLASLGVATFCLYRLTGIPWYVVFAALFIPWAYLNLQVAQNPPVAVAALCAGAYLLRQERYVLAGVVTSLSMIEPHIGLPGCLALFAFVPACRLALAAAAGVMAALSFAMIGVAANVEYFTRVLPLHALSEAGVSDQLSFTWLLHWFGVNDHTAVMLGSVSYLVMTIVGVVLAGLCARKYSAPYLLILVPPGVAMLGGAFVHNLQYLAVIPAALALAATINTVPSWIAVLIFAAPWEATWASKAWLALELSAFAVIAWHVVNRRIWPLRLWLAVGAAFILVTIAIGRTSTAPVRDAGSAASFYNSLTAEQKQLASANWGVVERRRPIWEFSSVRTLASKIPPWSGVVLMMGSAAFALVRRRSPQSEVVTVPSKQPRIAWTLLGLIVANLSITVTLSSVLNIDVDESYTLYTTSGTAHDAYDRALGFELQPPLYFVALQAWRQIDRSVFFGRLFSVVCIAATVLVAVAISRRVAPSINPAWLAAVVALNPFAIWCAVELRVYALLVLLASLLLLTFLDGFLADRPSLAARIGFGVVALTGMYSQYYIGFLLVGFGAALLVLRRWRALGAYAVVSAGVALAFLPVVAAVAHQTALWGSEASAGPSFARNFALLARHLTLIALPIHWARSALLFGGVVLVVAAFAAFAARTVAKAWPVKVPSSLGATAVAILVGGVALVVALSVTHQQFENRYAAIFLVPLLTCLCAAFGALEGGGRFRLAGGWLGIALAASCITLLVDYQALAKVGDWQRVAAYLMGWEKADEPILVYHSYGASPLRFYYRGENQLVGIPRTPSMNVYDPRDFELTSERDIERALARVPGAHRRIWVVATEPCDPAKVVNNCAIFETYLTKHYGVIRSLSFYKSTVREFARDSDESSAALPARHGSAGAYRSSQPRD